ncbi:muskelin-like [Tigriopus californicus]|uniref:muskelin-like n=1 Tax=Tigriopus californicus TaxID=6832 RepID=UPI0027DA7FCF|nr:muskelin-like [Tigriopus californicus]
MMADQHGTHPAQALVPAPGTTSASSLGSAWSASSLSPALGSSLRELSSAFGLTYTIHSCSSFSSTYVPEHILIDDPKDQASRWSSDSNCPPQFIMLRLSRPSVVSAITFGKFDKTHVCNLKRFKIWVGHEPDRLIEVLDSGLINDTTKETFRLRHVIHGHFFPAQYVKIVPLQSWGPSFNFSIWFVALRGSDAEDIVQPALRWHQEFREREAVRLCMKHFRERNFTEVFESLEKKTKIQLEHPLLSAIHKCLVIKGDFEETETMIGQAVHDGLFDQWIDLQLPTPKWKALILPDDVPKDNVVNGSSQTPENTPGQVSPNDDSPEDQERRFPVVAQPNPNEEAPAIPNQEADRSASSDQASTRPLHNQSNQTTSPEFRNLNSLGPNRPSCRGGHQMVIDVSTQTIYMFGGWDGNRDLNDFWTYNIATNKWTLLSINTAMEGGPDPRSCHKMVLDTTYKLLFLLGRYLDRGLRDATSNVKSDFFMYDIATSRWTLITDDTSAHGGPSLIFDHQMCFDQKLRTIYVFGGSIVQLTEGAPLPSDKRCSGLYEYHVPTNTWHKRRDDSQNPNAMDNQLRARSSHSMLFHEGLRKLFVFGGHRRRYDHLNDFFSYSVDTDQVEIISSMGSLVHSTFPSVGHTQRATIDCQRNEIHVMTGLNKDKDPTERQGDGKVSNSFWVYSIPFNSWTCFYKNESVCSEYWSRMQNAQPRPRYAHQLVYDDVNKIHYMFGGNPGGKQGKEHKLRLGDFWSLSLLRPTRDQIQRVCQLAIRRVHFDELVHVNKMAALKYLQGPVSDVVDHSDPQEEAEMRLLASQLFLANHPSERPTTDSSSHTRSHKGRCELFEKLSKYFPEDMTHPRINLLDLIPYPMEYE